MSLGQTRHIILNFHGIGIAPIEREFGEANYWISADFFEDILARIDHYRDRVRVSITFDDGNTSDLSIGAEGLLRYRIKARFFVLAGRIGDVGSLDDSGIRELLAMGHEIGNHGMDHIDWTTLDETGYARELEEARSKISQITGSPLTEAGIPFGRYNKRVIAELKQRGYARFYSSDGGDVTSKVMPLPRTSIRADMTPNDIDSILAGQEPFSRRLRRPLARFAKRFL